MQKTLFYPIDEHIAGNHVVMPFELLDRLVENGVEQVVFRTSTARYLASVEELQDADDVEIDDRWNKSIAISRLDRV
jgi:hypothetical protein